MIILDWRHPHLACGSLGNITALAYATEYIRDVLKQDVGVIVPDWHDEVWKLSVPLDRIYTIPSKDSHVRICSPSYYARRYKLLHWIQAPVACAGFWMDWKHKINPRVCWSHSRDSRRILLYPREYNNKNVLFTLEYWIAVGKILIENGWSIVAILDNSSSHRDGDVSVDWCNQFRDNVFCEYVFPPTIGGLQAAVGLSEISFGILSGPFWLMLKSTIRQIVISDPNDLILSHNARFNLRFVKKCISHVSGTSLDWISEL